MLVATIAASVIAYGVISLRVAQTVTQVERVPLDPPASSIATTYEDVTFNSRDGIVLKGWWFGLPGADRAVVMVHGRGRNRVNSDFMPAAIARLLLANRYSVLLFDLRGHGESGGTRYTLGLEEPRDILAAIDIAAKKATVDRARVAVIGESLGGGAAIMTVQADPSIGPVITDSAFADADTVVSESATKYTNLPLWFTPGIVLMSRLFLGLDISLVRPSQVVAAHPELPLHSVCRGHDGAAASWPGPQGREREPTDGALDRSRVRTRQSVRHVSGGVGATRPRVPRPRAGHGEADRGSGRYPRNTTTGRMTLATTRGRRVRWEDAPREDLMAGVQRRFLHGEKAMLAQIWLKKGTSVPKHVHPAEQLSFIVEGALRLRLGDDLSEVHDVRAGEVLVIPANVPHEATALEDTYDLDVFSPPREDWIKGQDAYLRGR